MLKKYTFESIEVKKTKSCKCLECGKKLKRTRTFHQTLNPFNKDDRGDIKTRGKILMEITIESEKWIPEVKTCEEHN